MTLEEWKHAYAAEELASLPTKERVDHWVNTMSAFRFALAGLREEIGIPHHLPKGHRSERYDQINLMLADMVVRMQAFADFFDLTKTRQ